MTVHDARTDETAGPEFHASDHLLTRPRPLIPLAPGFVRVLHRVSLIWAVVVVVFLEVSRRALWLRHEPGTETFEIAARPAFLVLFAIGTLIAWRWEIVGGAIAAFTAAGVITWQGNQLAQPDATLVTLAFVVPGLIWVMLDLHDRRPRTALIAIVVVSVAFLGGRAVATDIYDDLFGPTHPESAATLPPGTAFEWMWTGGVTESSAVVTARLDDDRDGYRRDASAEITVLDAPTGTPIDVVAVPDDHRIARFEIDGLQPDTEYTVMSGEAVEATFRTFPTGPASFTIALGSCARVGSNGAVWDAIRDLDPTLLVLDGDLHYANIDRVDAGLFQSVLDLQLSRPGPSALYRTTPVAYVWDDHDYGGNNGDSTSPTREVALATYRQYVPHYPLADSDDTPIYQAFDLGRARVILTDIRSARVPAGGDAAPTMLGADQLAWLEDELLTARDTHALIIWVNAGPWIGEADPSSDGWAGYSAERTRLADFIAEHDIDERLLMLSGDAHMVAIDDGTNTGYATGAPGAASGFPLLHAGALDRPGHVKGGPYSEGAIPGSGQFGLVTVDDLGDHLHVRLQGFDWAGTELIAYDYDVSA